MQMLSWPGRFGRSLFVRIFLVTIIAVVGFVGVFFATFRSALVFPAAVESLADPLSKVIKRTEDATRKEESVVLDIFASATRIAEVQEAFPDDATPRESFQQRLIRSSPQAERVLSGRDLRFRYLNPRRKAQDLSTSTRERFPAVTAFEVSARLEDGRVLIVLFSPASVVVERPGLVGMLFATASFVIAIIAALGIGLTLKPLSDLEAAAERFGATVDPEPIEERGPEEIRRVARALNRTQDQVRGLLAERARMISALAHDVLTSLTRLRLRVEQSKQEYGDAMTDEIAMLEVLIDDMLTYAKSGEPNHPVELIDVTSFIETYAKDAPRPLPLRMDGGGQEFLIAADPKALTRVFNNLIDNAVKYGAGASLVCQQSEAGFVVHIDDEGPGIPEHELTKVLEPFYRLETSRSRQTGGSGLGLGIADSLLRALGGQLTLSNRSPSGLRATVSFPSAIEVAS